MHTIVRHPAHPDRHDLGQARGLAAVAAAGGIRGLVVDLGLAVLLATALVLPVGLAPGLPVPDARPILGQRHR
jgi:hypothetical protein